MAYVGSGGGNLSLVNGPVFLKLALFWLEIGKCCVFVTKRRMSHASRRLCLYEILMFLGLSDLLDYF